jgi:hypothetical protein
VGVVGASVSAKPVASAVQALKVVVGGAVMVWGVSAYPRGHMGANPGFGVPGAGAADLGRHQVTLAVVNVTTIGLVT